MEQLLWESDSAIEVAESAKRLAETTDRLAETTKWLAEAKDRLAEAKEWLEWEKAWLIIVKRVWFLQLEINSISNNLIVSIKDFLSSKDISLRSNIHLQLATLQNYKNELVEIQTKYPDQTEFTEQLLALIAWLEDDVRKISYQ